MADIELVCSSLLEEGTERLIVTSSKQLACLDLEALEELIRIKEEIRQVVNPFKNFIFLSFGKERVVNYKGLIAVTSVQGSEFESFCIQFQKPSVSTKSTRKKRVERQQLVESSIKKIAAEKNITYEQVLTNESNKALKVIIDQNKQETIPLVSQILNHLNSLNQEDQIISFIASLTEVSKEKIHKELEAVKRCFDKTDSRAFLEAYKLVGIANQQQKKLETQAEQDEQKWSQSLAAQELVNTDRQTQLDKWIEKENEAKIIINLFKEISEDPTIIQSPEILLKLEELNQYLQECNIWRQLELDETSTEPTFNWNTSRFQRYTPQQMMQSTGMEPRDKTEDGPILKTSFTKALSLPDFTNTEKDKHKARAFIRTLETTARLSGWNPEEMSAAAQTCLKGQAGQWLFNSQKDIKGRVAFQEWKEFKKAFLARFHTGHTVMEKNEMIAKLKQKPNEDVLTFIDRIKYTQYILEEDELEPPMNAPENVLEFLENKETAKHNSEVLQKFYMGAKEEIRYAVQQAPTITTVEELRPIARRCEMNLQDKSGKVTNSPSEFEVATMSYKANQGGRNQWRGNRGGNRGNYRGTYRGNFRPNDFNCYNCNLKGHIARNCPSKHQGNQSFRGIGQGPQRNTQYGRGSTQVHQVNDQRGTPQSHEPREEETIVGAATRTNSDQLQEQVLTIMERINPLGMM